MYWVESEGCLLPKPIGGDPAVDFCNTLAGWGGPPLEKGEWLRDPDTFLVWTAFAGFVEPQQLQSLREQARNQPTEAAKALERARRLRAALYATLVSRDPDAFRAVARVSEEAAKEARLVQLADGHVEWTIPPGLGLRGPVLLIARAAADFLTSEHRDRVRVCPGNDCGWLFINRQGRRRWCSMETCGNRAKVRAHARRQQPERDR